ncbi:MAG: hypothetical protein KGL74_04680 [Elusimicrobia bacterium]|nr:hypothetical protein [Elusimicrobiota bacterium]
MYPVAADPFQRGHLLIALRAVGDLGVDKVVFVQAGDDHYRLLDKKGNPDTLPARFLDHVGFDASSTQVRGGRHTLMPFAAYDFARRNEGLYGVTPAAPDAGSKP